MAHNVQVHIWPEEIGAGVNERGNVEIVGVDRSDGTIVKIEIHSEKWKHVLTQLGRLRGVGIVKAMKPHLEIANEIPENGEMN
jgi:hypothetical protein